MIAQNTGFSPSQIYDLDTHIIFSLLTSIAEKQKNHAENLRAQLYYSVAPHLKVNSSIHEFMPFPWDADTTKSKEPISKEDVEKTLAEFQRFIPQSNG